MSQYSNVFELTYLLVPPQHWLKIRKGLRSWHLEPIATTAQPRPKEARIAAIAGRSIHHLRPTSCTNQSEQENQRYTPPYRPCPTVKVAGCERVRDDDPQAYHHVAGDIDMEDRSDVVIMLDQEHCLSSNKS